jgi:DNA topoisomerase IA
MLIKLEFWDNLKDSGAWENKLHQGRLSSVAAALSGIVAIKDFLEKCKIFDFEYTSTPPKKNIKKPPEPLTTSTLQQTASNELHLSPKDTMKYAQQLYEGGYITYMRTDSKKYSVEFVDKAKAYIKSKIAFSSPGDDSLICIIVLQQG